MAWLVALAVTAISVVVGRRIAPSINLVDKPDDRKKHIGDVPLIGGIAIYLGVFSALFASGQITEHLPYLVGAFLIVAAGVWDDASQISPYIRLIIQAIAIAVLAIWGGVYIADLGHIMPGGNLLNLGSFGIPFTIIAGVGLINAFNMADGLDGLCGSLALVALAGATAVGISSGGSHLEVRFLFVLSAAVVSFLLFNFPFPGRKRATAFLGDAGSYLLGFSVLYAVVRLSNGQTRAMPPVSALWFCLLPLLDMGGISIRRIIRGRSPFNADREHLHHVFTYAKFSVTETTSAMALVGLLGVLLGITFTVAGVHEGIIFLCFVIVAALYLWRMIRTWKLLRFLSRSIDRRVGSLDQGAPTTDRRREVVLEVVTNPNVERRVATERREEPNEEQLPVVPVNGPTGGFSAGHSG